MNLEKIVSAIDDVVWGPYMLVFLVGTGIFLTIRLKFLPWRNLWYAIKSVFAKSNDAGGGKGDISPFQSLMTALAATIGTGNIAGVATALVSGGAGAIVWMWVSALFGLSTKYAESVLAVKYREVNSAGEMVGGPMYALKNGLKNKTLGLILAVAFSLFAVLASFGIGNMTQANSISNAVNTSFGVPLWVSGLVMVALCFAVLLGGIKSIGRVCGVIVPVMAIFYIVAALAVIIINSANLPAGLREILRMAFSVKAIAGGVGGTIVKSMMDGMRYGIARGVFSNEAGLGSAPIAAAAAKTDRASRQGYINMTGTFFDTIIICTLTGLAIASSGMLGTVGADGKLVDGIDLTMLAFQEALGPIGKYVISIGIILFAFSTILGWEYYGERSLEFLVRKRVIMYIYRVVFCLITFVGATTDLSIAWSFSDIANGLMAVPNLLSLLILNKDIAKECFAYQREVIKKEA